MILKNEIQENLQDPLKENILPSFAEKLNINHTSPTQFALPDAAWLFKYVIMDQKMRRELLDSNSAMEAGKRVGEALQRHYADTIYKLHPTTKKVAPTTNDKISLDNAIQEQIEIFKEYNPVDDKDSDKKIKYLEEVPSIVANANLGLQALGVASPVTCERQISITADKLDSFFHSPLLPVVGRIDFDFGNQVGFPKSEISNNEISDGVSSTSGFLPTKIVELKTKYSRLGKIKKNGQRSFLSCYSPATPSFNHLVQVATYAANFNFKVPVYLIYATEKDYKIFDSTNSKHLTIDGMKRNLQIMFRTFLRREKLLSQYQDYTKEEIIENAVQMIDPNFDHPFAWNGIPEELMQQARDLWKVN